MISFQIPAALLLLLSTFSWAGHEKLPPPIKEGAKKCIELLETPDQPGAVHLVPSGRDADVVPTYRDDLIHTFGPGGVAHQLGYALPEHILEMMPPHILAVYVSLGRHALPTWMDGSDIVKNSPNLSGVLEIVTPGDGVTCSTCHSVYSDILTPEQMRAIFFHVAGHNDVSARSLYFKQRNADPSLESRALAHLLKQTKIVVDNEQVQEFLMHLETLSSVQDYAAGTFTDPAQLAPRAETRFNPKHPQLSTASVLQAAVTNLPATSPLWKKRVLAGYERMKRVTPAVVATKIMNEGWATFSEEILLGHSRYRDSNHNIEFAQLFNGILGKGLNLQNPYLLGFEAWRCIQRRWEKEYADEIANITALERDRRFVKYAHDIIAQYNDYDFVRMALDAQWVADKKLLLTRKAKRDEVDPHLPPPPGESTWNLDQHIVASKDARLIIDKIAQSVADKRMYFARILLENMNGLGRGTVELKHDLYKNIPLKKYSAAQSLYVLSQIFEKPVSLQTVKASTWKKAATKPKIQSVWAWSGWKPTPPPEKTTLSSIRIEVAPSGEVRVFDLELNSAGATTHVTLNAPLTQDLQNAVDYYRSDLSIGTSDEKREFDSKKFGSLISATINMNTPQVSGLLSHVPGAADAGLEYTNMIEKRLLGMTELAARGLLPIKMTKKGTAKFRVLPLIPRFELDHDVYEKMKREISEDESGVTSLNNPALHFFPESVLRALGREKSDSISLASKLDRYDLDSGDEKIGDRHWRKKPDEDKGSEEGDENEDGEDQSDEPGESMGDSSGKITDVEVPLELLYNFLDLELPNRKSKSLAPNLGTDVVWEDLSQASDGNIQFAEMVPIILSRGDLALRRKGINPSTVSRTRRFKEGLKKISPTDHIVSDFEVVPDPQSKALIIRICDMSGSMHGLPQQLLKQFYYRMEVLLRKKYKQIEYVNIGFNDSKALIMSDKDFFSKFLSGGDRYILGWKKGTEIATDPKYKGYDIYGFMAGDAQSFGGPDVTAAMHEFHDLLNFGGFIQTTVNGDYAMPDLIVPVKSRAQDDKWFAFGTLDAGKDSMWTLLKDFFGKGKRK